MIKSSSNLKLQSYFYETFCNEKKEIDMSYLNIYQIYKLGPLFSFRLIKHEKSHQNHSSNGIELFELYASVVWLASIVFQKNKL